MKAAHSQSGVQMAYVCQECGGQSKKWSGKCPHCQAWNSLVEEALPDVKSVHPAHSVRGFSRLQLDQAASSSLDAQAVLLQDVQGEQQERWQTTWGDLDLLLGGGIVPGSLVLVGGEPGIGKSTLLLQLALRLAAPSSHDKSQALPQSQSNPMQTSCRVLYASGEESALQIKQRAQRLEASVAQGEVCTHVDRDILILSEVNLDAIQRQVLELKPQVLIVDSIQIVYLEQLGSAPGSVAQVRECANALMLMAKKLNMTVFIVGHVTKEGQIAGPRVLEHIVDTVLYFEGERHHHFRLLRAVKNRFGSTNEVGLFEMRETGLHPVDNPSEMFLASSQGLEHGPGSVVVPALEGTRPLLMEIQALVAATHSSGHPRRVSTGIDHNRMALLIAIFEKSLGISLAGCDVFINLVGGLRVLEPALDLGVLVAMASSWHNHALPRDLCVIGEVGLGGEVRRVSHMDKRLREAQRLGFQHSLLPQQGQAAVLSELEMQLSPVRTVEETMQHLFH